MKIDACFIACAGFGSRMGEISASIPKPLLPIFNQSILETLVKQVQSLGIQKVIVNTHHLSKVIEEFVERENLDCIIVNERRLLGSGGCFYNLKKNFPELEHILSLNGDLVLDINKKLIENCLKEFIDSGVDIGLLSAQVESSFEGNRLLVEGNLLRGLSKEKSNKVTFSGMSIVNLNKLDKIFNDSVSGFFESVSNFKAKKILVFDEVLSSWEDFGTKERYLSSHEKIFKDKSHFMRDHIKNIDGRAFSFNINGKIILVTSEKITLSS